MFLLLNFIFSIIIGFIEGLLDLPPVLSGLYTLAILLPSLAVCVRRLHDIGRSGWWLFITLVPLVGGIILLVFNCTDSDEGENKYGPNPKLDSSPKEVY